MSQSDALQHWREEQRSEYLYRQLAVREPDARIASMFAELADASASQALTWQQLIESEGGAMPVYTPDGRTRLLTAMLRLWQPRKLHGLLAASKVRGLSVYTHSVAGHELAEHAMPSNVAEVGGRHRTLGNNGGLRAAVFGVNDGLVSIACLVLGVAGANAGASMILLTGVAGLLAGAFSMAAGEYVSMRSQRELFEYQIALERAELAQYPEQEAAELALIYQARGLDAAEAQRLAAKMVANPVLGLDVLAREELGLNPDELGSPWWAAGTSFAAFMLGGLVPLLPWLLEQQIQAIGDYVGWQLQALWLAIALTGVTLFAVGAALALFSGRSLLYGGARMLSIGAAAGAATYFIGVLFAI